MTRAAGAEPTPLRGGRAAAQLSLIAASAWYISSSAWPTTTTTDQRRRTNVDGPTSTDQRRRTNVDGPTSTDEGRPRTSDQGRRSTTKVDGRTSTTTVDGRRTKVDGPRSTVDGPRSTDERRRRRSTDQGRRSTDERRRRRSTDQGRRSTDQGRRSTDQGRRSTDQGRRTNVDGPRSTDERRRRRSTDQGRRTTTDQGRRTTTDQGRRTNVDDEGRRTKVDGRPRTKVDGRRIRPRRHSVSGRILTVRRVSFLATRTPKSLRKFPYIGKPDLRGERPTFADETASRRCGVRRRNPPRFPIPFPSRPLSRAFPLSPFPFPLSPFPLRRVAPVSAPAASAIQAASWQPQVATAFAGARSVGSEWRLGRFSRGRARWCRCRDVGLEVEGVAHVGDGFEAEGWLALGDADDEHAEDGVGFDVEGDAFFGPFEARGAGESAEAAVHFRQRRRALGLAEVSLRSSRRRASLCSKERSAAWRCRATASRRPDTDARPRHEKRPSFTRFENGG